MQVFPSLLLSVLLALQVNGIRQYCGGSCSSQADCLMPNGVGGTFNGACCGGSCTLTPTPVTRGGSCDVNDPCKICAIGLVCADADGNLQGSGSAGPFTCNQFLKQWTPGCKCDNSTQCIGSTTNSICGSEDSVCLATRLYSGSSCKFSTQCRSGWCEGGTCRGRANDVPEACSSPSSSDQCDLGKRCSVWGVPPTLQCHGLSGEGGICYDSIDCASNQFNAYPDQQCVTGGSGTGRCTKLSGLGEVCGTATTTSTCAWYTVSSSGFSYKTQYTCNTSTTPPRCTQPVALPTLPLGSACDSSSSTGSCVSTGYCETNTKQPPITSFTPGTCVAKGNVPLGGNCSSTLYSCTPNVCAYNSSKGLYQCIPAVDSLGKACDHKSTVMDSVQCPNTAYTLYCACNDTCSRPPSSTNNIYCSSYTTRDYTKMFPTNLPLTPAMWAVAEFQGNRDAVIDYLCCNYCDDTTELARSAASTGVVVDCGSKTIHEQKICDNNYPNQAYLKNCDKYQPRTSAGVTTTFSLSFLVMFFFAVFIVQ